MNLFHHKPAYTQEQINQQVSNLEKLNKLRDMCWQKSVLVSNGQPTQHQLDSIRRWSEEAERYSRNIESGQRYLDYMQERSIEKSSNYKVYGNFHKGNNPFEDGEQK